MKNQTKFYLCIIFLLIPIQTILPQTIKLRTMVQITLDQRTSQETGSELTDSIKQELSKSEDVELVTDGPDILINIMMLQNRTTKGDTLGYILSTIFLTPPACQGTKNYSYLTSLLSTAKESEFGKTAENIVSTFNEIKSTQKKNK